MSSIYIEEEMVEDYLFTLEICRKELPPEAHYVHKERLDRLLMRLEALSKRDKE